MIEQRLDELRRAWRGNRRAPDLERFLTEDLRAEAVHVAELIALDAEIRWDRGLPAGIEHYAPLLAGIDGAEDAILQLAMIEAVRSNDGEAGSLFERYVSRFPGLREDLSLAFDFCGEMEDRVDEASDALTPLEPGLELEQYELVREVGRGSFGIVWQAWDSHLQRHVALKLLRPRRIEDRATATRVLSEAQSAAAVDHPNVVKVHASGSFPQNALHFIDSQLVADPAPSSDDPDAVRVGRSLARDAREGADRPDPRRVAEIVRDVSSGVAAAHARGVIHRDIKPANVILTPTGRPMIADFGLSSGAHLWRSVRTDGAEATLSLQSLGSRLVGSPAYMSPEQARGDVCTPLSDVYGLGALLYALLARRPPYLPTGRFNTDAVLDVISQVRETDVPPLRTRNPDAPPVLEAICARAMAPVPEDRYPSADHLARDLELYLERRPTSVEPRHAWYALGSLVRRHPRVSAALGVAALLIVVGTAWSVISLRRERDLVRDAVHGNDRMADVFIAKDVQRKAEELWPPTLDRVPLMRRWVTYADELLRRRDRHVAEIDRLRAAAIPYDEELRRRDLARRRRVHASLFEELEEARVRREEVKADLDRDDLDEDDAEDLLDELEDLDDLLARLEKDPRLDERIRWTFTSDAEAWRHEVHVDLLSRLDAIAATREEVAARIERAHEIHRRSLVDHADEWDRCIADIRTHPAYAGLDLTPQEGLVPLGRDEGSDLWEFWHVASGGRPKWEGDPYDGRVRPAESDGIVLVLIPAGSFWMGAQSETMLGLNHDPWSQFHEVPVHRVSLDAFFMAKYEMTQAQFIAVMKRNPSNFAAGSSTLGIRIDGRFPVENLTHGEAREAMTRLGLVLPTEAQWEYAARAGTTTRFWTGQEVTSLQGKENVCDRSHKRHRGPFFATMELDDGAPITSPVGRFAANPWGLYDVLGNVQEWCREKFLRFRHPPLSGDGARYEIWSDREEEEAFTCVRGGSALRSAKSARTGRRGGQAADTRTDKTGVRAARAIDRKRLP